MTNNNITPLQEAYWTRETISNRLLCDKRLKKGSETWNALVLKANILTIRIRELENAA